MVTDRPVIRVAAVDVLPRACRHQRHDIAIIFEDDVAQARVVDRRAHTAVGSFLIGQSGMVFEHEYLHKRSGRRPG